MTATTLGLAAIAWAGPASASEKILLLQKPVAQSSSDAFTNLATLMGTLGYDVTTIRSGTAAVPVDVDTYAQVYLLSDGLMTTTDASMLVSYVQGGGRLLVSGENDNSPSNQQEDLIMQEYVLKPLVMGSTSLTLGPPPATPGIVGLDVLSERSGFSAHPNALSKMYVYTSGFLAGVADANVFLKDPTNGPVGAIWLHDELTGATPGCVMALADITIWEVPSEPSAPLTNADLTLVVENVHDLLKYCGDHDLDGLLDAEETALGTDPKNPDSDGDGLCDGTIAVADPAVPETCIAGEDAKGGQKTAGPMIDALNPDDDGDGIPTKTELTDSTTFGSPHPKPWLDLDSDGDGVPDAQEGRKHFNAQGVPDYLDPDYPTPQAPGSGTDGGSASSGSDAGNGDGAGGGSGGNASGCGCFVTGARGSSAEGMGALGLVALALLARPRRRTRRR